MQLLKNIFYKIGNSIKTVFSVRNLGWHILAILITYVSVTSGFDWEWYTFFQGHSVIFKIMFPAAIIGFLIPLCLPLLLFWQGREDMRVRLAGFALIQAEFLGWVVSSLYKAFTGRLHPDLLNPAASDISRIFNFGFLKGGIFWGWPSSHTTVAFAMAFCLIALYPEIKKIKYSAVIYAFYIGLGVSMSIHWFSDFAAGAIIGAVIGTAVGRNFYRK